MNNVHRFLLALLAAFVPAFAASGAEFDHSHALLGKVLQTHVKDALVNYAALKAAPQDLNAYLDQLATVKEAEFNKWSEKQQLAFLINLYNAATLRLIIDHYPVTSVKKIGGVFGSPWKQDVVPLFGMIATLGYVEHGLLRVKYQEPRIHFAIVCAAHGCPSLRGEAYTPEKLDAQLEDQGRRFLAAREKNSVDAAGQVVRLSPIFKWFSEDFEKKSGTVLKFVTPYFPDDARKRLEKGGFKIKYTDYDWSLNDSSRPK